MGKMKLNVERIKEYIELKEVNKSGSLYKGNGVKTTILTMTSVFTPEVARKRLDQE